MAILNPLAIGLRAPEVSDFRYNQMAAGPGSDARRDGKSDPIVEWSSCAREGGTSCR